MKDDFIVFGTCYECGAELTEEEIDIFGNGETCCDGHMCGCRGLPINPPYCKKCMSREVE